MTEQEYNQAVQAGQVEAVQPIDAPAQAEELKPLTPDDYQPILDALRRPRRNLSTAPTFVPKTFADSIQPFDDGVDQGIYVYVNNAWLFIGGSAPSSRNYFDSFLDIVHWSALDGFQVNTGGGATARVDDAVLYMNVTGGAGAATTTGIYSRDAYNKLFETGKEVTVEWQIAYIDGTDLGLIGWLVLTDVATTPVVSTDDHIGFKLVGLGSGGLNGAVEIYASTGDGAAQTISNTGVTITFGEIGQIIRRRFKAVFIPGTSCKFYIDDVLVATHTTNLPNIDSPRNNLSIASAGSAMGRSMKLNRILIHKEY